MLDCDSMVFSRGLLVKGFHHVQQLLHAKVSIVVYMDLKAISPVNPHGVLQFFWRRDPLAIVSVYVSVFHLHQLGIERSVTKTFDMVVVENHLIVT